ncbi:aldehyde dehydrogenase [Amycolatopsis acidicola]|uniref:Aldehyde dehydrogenase n=1 Tax=Amycolatopsis acidicola TaxID=2596893 RepID=A0A5N0V2I1_9PSEU|nr:aldehyde dehydrogenase [Amycolatopsis acidicola]KAA9160576.1 aldehyde dehydrogenase [Amycolatopsis acidicola]
MYVDSAWTEMDSDESVEVIEAATEKKIGSVSLGNARDVDRAVRAARTALDHGAWGRMSRAERAGLMLGFADELEARAEETATLVSRQNGTPIALSREANGTGPAATLRMYAGLAAEADTEEVRASPNGATIVRREPVGVVGAITPWNYPQTLAVMKIAPALAMGCTVVLKPSPETSLDAFVFGEAAAAAGIPQGVINIVPGSRDTGANLVSHPLVDKIAFTGSTAAGRAIGAECGRLIRPCTLELGGKSASIVLEDADLDVFAAGLGESSFRNNGQTCALQTRILAPRSRYDEVVDVVADFAGKLVLGDPLDPSVTCGPMVSAAHRARVLAHIDGARARGVRLVTGGGRPEDQEHGWFVEPTVFVDVANSDPIAREEVFGPVVAVIPYDDDDDAVGIANDSDYGLGGSVWTSDEARGLEIARRVRTGTIGINHYTLDLGSPFGGMKDSGLGRELGPEALDAYTEYKSVYASARRLS